MKKIMVINDLSSFGRCSLTAAISVISAMGIQPCPLPTAILSAQTGYPSYYCDDYTDKMQYISSEWEKMKVQFDGIYTGFVASEGQIEAIFDVLEKFNKENTILVVDPVMGDNGKAFPFFTEKLRSGMKALAVKADVITPNLTELCLLTERDCRIAEEITDKETLLLRAEEIAKEAVKKGPRMIVVTGLRFRDEEEKERMGNLAVTETKSIFSSFPYVGGSYSGTGDLFTSVLAAGLMRGDRPETCIELAGDFICRSITDAVAHNVPRNEGVNFEPYLKMLM